MTSNGHFLFRGDISLSRRRFVKGLAAGGVLTGLGLRAGTSATLTADSRCGPRTLCGNRFDLKIRYQSVNFTGTQRNATTINGSLPAPVLVTWTIPSASTVP